MNTSVEKIPKMFLRYKTLEVLGKGGNGTVYRVEDTETGQILALKVLNQTSEIILNRFKKEFFSLKKMEHECIVKVFESYFDHSPPFFTLEWIQGKTLGQIISDMRKNPLIFTYPDREEFSRQVGLQLCEVIAYIHSFDEIHRDLKPDNIFITRGTGNLLKGFKIKILDFGLLMQLNSHQANRDSQQGMVIGTVQFLSPEQAKGGRLDARSDLFSIGVILYNILSLGLPFKAEDLVGYLFQIVFEEPIPLLDRIPEISPPMNKIVNTLLEKDPSKRYPSSLALHRALDWGKMPDSFHGGSQQTNLFEGFGDPLLPPRLIARDPDIETMLDLAHHLNERSPSVLFLNGENGLGKTFLINEWLSQLHFETKSVFKLTFSGQNTPGQDPVGILMDSLLKKMPPQEIQETFNDIYPFLYGVSRYLNRYFDMPNIENLEHLSSARKRQLIASNFNKLTIKMSDKGPVLMTIEDIHLAPDSFFDWLDIFLEQLNIPNFLMVMTFTSSSKNQTLESLVKRLEERGITQQITLAPISVDETRRLLQSMIPVSKEIPFSLGFDQFIKQNSSGNPLLAIELFTQLYKENGLKIKKGILELSRKKFIRMPDTIHQALLLKIQKLPISASHFVESACVFGDEFELSWLKELLNWEEEAFFSVFMKLIRIGIFREEDELVHKIYFRNTDLRDMIYSGLPDHRKTKLHRSAAQAIEYIYNDSRGDTDHLGPARTSLFLENLSLHYSKSNSFVPAIKFAYLSGTMALKQKNTSKAISLYTECHKLMKLSNNRRTLNLVNLKLGEVFLADHKFGKAISYFESSLKSKHKSKIEELRIYKGLTQAYRHLRRYEEALQSSEEMVQLSLSCSPVVTADSLVERGLLVWEKSGDGQELQRYIIEAEANSSAFPNKDYLKPICSLFANDLKNTIKFINQGKSKNISPTPFLLILAWLNYMSGQFKKSFSYLDKPKKGEKEYPIDPKAMVFKSLLTYLLKRKISPDHSADEYIHMAKRYQKRFDLQNNRIHIDLFLLEDFLLHNQPEKANSLLDEYKNGQKLLPRPFFERKMFLCMAHNVIWRQSEIPPPNWLDEFQDFEPNLDQSFLLTFHYALALNAQALLPHSDMILKAEDALEQSIHVLKKFNLKYYQAIILRNQIELSTKLKKTKLTKKLKKDFHSVKQFTSGFDVS